MSLKNKTALITGASSGIGAACAKKLAERGCSVIASGRNKKKIQSLAESINGHSIVADLNDTDQIEKLFSEAGDRIDILINSAGVAPKASIINGDPSDYRELLNVNVLALTLCCQFIQYVRPQSAPERRFLCCNQIRSQGSDRSITFRIKRIE